ncbi:MAG: cell wall hydrolase [Lachnospiraceae bacterium]|nr:cell wall hydrolase [Lachnospiraceae bacterium]
MKRRGFFDLKFIVIALTVFALSFTCYTRYTAAEPSSSSKSAEQRKKEAEESKAAEEKRKKEMEEEKARTEREKQETEQQKKETEAYLSEVNKRAIDLNTEAASAQQKYEDKRQEVSDTAQELKSAEEQVKLQYENMKKRFKFIYEKGTTGYIEVILESRSISEMINRTQYVSKVLESDKALLEAFKGKVLEINGLKQKLEQDESDLKVLSADANNKLAQARNSIEEAKQTIREQDATIRDQEESIRDKEDEIAVSAARIKALEKEILIADKEIGTTGGTKGEQTTEQKVTKTDSVSVGASDRDMIAAMIWCEVGAEGMEEKKGVASVIVNRLKSTRYPNTVQAVLFQNMQFAPTWEMTSDGTTSKFMLALANGAPSACYSAADWALAGNSNVGDAIGFKLASTGIEGIVIGKVVFFNA